MGKRKKTEDLLAVMPLPDGAWQYTDRMIVALQVAAVMHAGQVRKGSGVPYLTHLLGTCAIALEYGANEDEAIAALLHDAIEDVRPTKDARKAVEWFGAEVYRIVVGCTDGVPDESGQKPEWDSRKQAYIDHLADATRSVLLVSAADKLHNARSIVADQRAIGDEVFSRFRNGKDDTLAYYRNLVHAFQGNPASNAALVAELDRVVRKMEKLAAAAPAG
jgi:(p)ppGpp synthase/HD superfamily hydrolase